MLLGRNGENPPSHVRSIFCSREYAPGTGTCQGLQLVSPGHDLFTCFVPHSDGIDGASIACPQQALTLDRVGLYEDGDGVFIELEGFRGFLHTVPEPHALVTIDDDAEPVDLALVQAAHIPSSPNSVRAVSIKAGVISVMPRSRAYSP